MPYSGAWNPAARRGSAFRPYCMKEEKWQDLYLAIREADMGTRLP